MAKKEEVIGIKPKVEVQGTQTVENYEIFGLVTKGEKTQIAIGNYLIVEEQFENVEAAKNYIDSKPWKLIVNTTCCIYDLTNKMENQKIK